MSEPHSLFARISISNGQFEAFLASSPAQPVLDQDWLQWWESRDMHGKTELRIANVYAYAEPTNAAIVSGWTESRRHYGFSDYDPVTEVWRFGILLFSSSYDEMIPALAFVRSAAAWKTPDADDFAIIYSHVWGSPVVCAFLAFDDGKSTLDPAITNRSDVDPRFLGSAEAYLGKKWDAVAAAQAEAGSD